MTPYIVERSQSKWEDEDLVQDLEVTLTASGDVVDAEMPV